MARILLLHKSSDSFDHEYHNSLNMHIMTKKTDFKVISKVLSERGGGGGGDDKRHFIALNFMWMKSLKLLFCLPIAEHTLALDIRENSLFLGQLFDRT